MIGPAFTRTFGRAIRASGLALALAACVNAPARADRATDQVGLAASGRFDGLTLKGGAS